jgi:pimeloyl-ACP methyl ester carboxylesterase
MKTLLSSGLVGFSFVLVACSAADDTGSPAATTAAPATATPAATPPPASVNDAPAAVPSAMPVPPGASGESPPTTLELTPDPLLSATPELRWRACGQFDNRNIECAELEVPVDYADPDGARLTLALRRILASPLEPPRGALLFNPGGPGGPGIDVALDAFAYGIFDRIAPGFDIIGFDPRGVAESGERGCGIYPEDLYPETMTSPMEGPEAYVNALRDFGEQCEQEWGPLFRQLGSNNVVRDIEEIRKALQAPVLNFFGASYGTRLGALYAHAYPQTTGRIVLDAPVHPRANFVEIVRAQFRQAIRLHELVLSACEAGELSCPPEPRQVFEQMRSNARARGLEELFVSMWRNALGTQRGLQSIVAGLASEAADPGGDWILSFLSSEDDGGLGLVAFSSVSCTDDTAAPPTIEQIEALEIEFVQASPLFAGDVIGVARCTGWPATRDPVPLPTAIDARPLLVIGGTLDLRTPYAWAQAMTETLGNATLLTSNHFGHVAIGNGGDCVQQAIRAYLTSGSLPASGASCD